MEPLLGKLAALAAQAPQEPDPGIVTPGLLGLVLVLMLGVAIVFLYRSMNRQLKRVNLPEPPAQDDGDDEQPSAP